MPFFECPQCGKLEVIPLALCESLLHTLPPLRPGPDRSPVYGLRCRACTPMKVEVVEGDLLSQGVDVIVNAWNRNIIPWWILLPQGVSGAIKRLAGTGPFREVRRHGAIPLGGAVLTSAGRLPFQGIIHVTGINMLWRASGQSIRRSVKGIKSREPNTAFREGILFRTSGSLSITGFPKQAPVAAPEKGS